MYSKMKIMLRAKALWEQAGGCREVKKKGLAPKFEESPILSG